MQDEDAGCIPLLPSGFLQPAPRAAQGPADEDAEDAVQVAASCSCHPSMHAHEVFDEMPGPHLSFLISKLEISKLHFPSDLSRFDGAPTT